MKKLLYLVYFLALVVLLFSCGETPASVSDESGISRFTESDPSAELNYPTKYIRTDGYAEGTEYPSVFVLASRADLEKYTYENENNYDFNASYDSVSFYDTVTRYDEAFFSQKSLVVILVSEPCGSYTHSLREITRETDGSYKMNLMVFTHETDTEDEAQWHILVEVAKDSPLLDDPQRIYIEENYVRV